MIELRMVHRMARRALLLAPPTIAALWIFGSGHWALSGAAGLAMTVINLWFSAQVIGRVAENNPQLLLAAGLVAFMLALLLLVGIALALRASDLVYFPVTGLVLIGSHFVVVLWEAAGAYSFVQPEPDKTLDWRHQPAETKGSWSWN